MSENPLLNVNNITESFQTTSTNTNTTTTINNPSQLQQNRTQLNKFEDATKIFNLINQLNNTLNNNNGTDTSCHQAHETTDDGLHIISTQIQPLSDNTTTPNRPSHQQKASTTSAAITTKIPRMNFAQSQPAAAKPPLPSPPPAAQNIMISSTSNSSMSSSSAAHNNTNNNNTTASPHAESTTTTAATTSMIPRVSRVPRSVVRNSNLVGQNGTESTSSIQGGNEDNTNANNTNNNTNNNNNTVNSNYFNNTNNNIMRASGIPKRGVSLSNAPKMKTTRSMSINDSKENMDDCESVISSEGKKVVKYIIRHKPRESQVKIFSKKMEIKTAASKINSLEKAANYTPSGGNVKIESHKLNWNAKSKIGSLEKASTYTPSGGNVKIESHKLNFREKARPKTDTGLIVVEEYINKSLNNSNEDLTKSQLSFTGSN